MVFNGEFMPGNQWVSPENPLLSASLSDPEARRRQGQGADERRRRLRRRFDVDFMVPKGAETQAVAEVIQAMAAEIGINMKIRVTEFATSLKQAEQGNYQAYLLAWSGRTDPDGNTYIFFKCNAPQNSMGYCNADVDKLLDEARVPSELAARKAIYEKLTKTDSRGRSQNLSRITVVFSSRTRRNLTATRRCRTASCA